MNRQSVAELVCVRLAREVEDGDLVVLGSFTPMAFAAYMLAKTTRAPSLYLIAYSALDVAPFALSLAGSEAGAMRRPAGRIEMVDVVHRIHQRGRGDVEAVSAPQMDAELRFNYSWIGRGKPRPVRLPGGAGAPEVVRHHRKLLAYFPRHRREVLTDEVEYVSASRRGRFGVEGGVTRVITDLAVMTEAGGRLVVETLHPGVSREQVESATGFELVWPATVPETAPPTETELEGLRRVDPDATIRLEFVAGAERQAVIDELLAADLARAEAMLG